MKKIIYRFGIFACIVIFSAIIIYGCKRENLPSSNKNNIEKSSIASLKEQFTSLKYDALLTTQINDTVSLYLEPKWEYFTTKNAGDSISYTYILLKPTIKIKNKPNNNKKLSIDYIRQYLLVKEQKNKKTGFSIARYILDEKTTNSLKGKKINSLSTTALSTSFTGELLIRDLGSNLNKAYSFNKGTVQPELVKNRTVSNNKLSINEVCQYDYYCQYISGVNCPAGGSYMTYTLNHNSCACPTYSIDCSGHETSGDAGNYNCAYKGWIKVDQTIVVRNCNDGTPGTPDPVFPVVVNPPTPPPIFPPNGLVCVRLDRENLQTYTDNVDPSTQSYRDQEYADITMRFFSDVTCTIPVAANPAYGLTYWQSIYSNYWGGSNINNYYITVHNANSTSTSIYLGYLPTYSYNTFYDQSQGQIVETNTYYYSILTTNQFNIID